MNSDSEKIYAFKQVLETKVSEFCCNILTEFLMSKFPELKDKYYVELLKKQLNYAAITKGHKSPEYLDISKSLEYYSNQDEISWKIRENELRKVLSEECSDLILQQCIYLKDNSSREFQAKYCWERIMEIIY